MALELKGEIRMNNKEKIQTEADRLNLKIGTWNKKIEALSEKELSKVIVAMEYQNDVDILYLRRRYVVEIDIVGNEIDFSVLSREEYINRYGSDRYEDD